MRILTQKYDASENILGISGVSSLNAYMIYDFVRWSNAGDYTDAELAGLIGEEKEAYKENWYGQRALDLSTSDTGAHPTVIDTASVGYGDCYALFAYTVDQDGNKATVNDRDVFMQVYNFQNKKFEYIVRLTSETVLDKNGEEVDLDIVTLGEKYTFKMPPGSVTVKATFMEDNTMLNYFVDVNAQDYFYDAVLWAAESGITSGTDDSHFSPNAPCTRAQIVTFLWRAAGSPVVNHAMNLSDVSGNAYYAEAVRWALSEGITKGTTETTFSPDAACTRVQAVTFLYRASGSPAVSGSVGFDDVADGAYYADAVKWAVAEGITEGTSADTFSPDSDCTRAQIVTFLWRAYNR